MFVNSSDWKWLLDSFADRVADKEYKKTDYQVWRRLKNYDSAHIYYINRHDIGVEDAEKDLAFNTVFPQCLEITLSKILLQNAKNLRKNGN